MEVGAAFFVLLLILLILPRALISLVCYLTSIFTCTCYVSLSRTLANRQFNYTRYSLADYHRLFVYLYILLYRRSNKGLRVLCSLNARLPRSFRRSFAHAVSLFHPLSLLSSLTFSSRQAQDTRRVLIMLLDLALAFIFVLSRDTRTRRARLIMRACMLCAEAFRAVPHVIPSRDRPPLRSS